MIIIVKVMHDRMKLYSVALFLFLFLLQNKGIESEIKRIHALERIAMPNVLPCRHSPNILGSHSLRVSIHIGVTGQLYPPVSDLKYSIL
jgi:hypothetical protein